MSKLKARLYLVGDEVLEGGLPDYQEIILLAVGRPSRDFFAVMREFKAAST